MLVDKVLARQGEISLNGLQVEYVTLDWEQRQKRRLRVRTDGGREIGIALASGGLCDGDILACTGGVVVVVRAAPEHVLAVWPRDRQEAAVVGHLLGNRHMPLWIEGDELLAWHDPLVAEALLAQNIPFAPQYRPLRSQPLSGGGHGHGHSQGHEQDGHGQDEGLIHSHHAPVEQHHEHHE